MGNATSLHKAAESQDLAELRIQVQKHPSAVNTQDTNTGWTPLHVAAAKGFDPGVRELLARGSQPDAQDKAGRTPLHLAAERGHAKVVADLMRRGASTAVTDKAGRSPYDYAVQRHPTVAAMLGGPLPHAAAAAAATMPRINLPAAVSANQLLPTPPPSSTLGRTLQISTGAGGGSLPRVLHEQAPVQPLLSPPPPLSSSSWPAAQYPAGPGVAAAADFESRRGYGTGAAAAAAAAAPLLPYPQPGPQGPAEQRHALYTQPQAPVVGLPYPAVPATQQPSATEGRRSGDGGGGGGGAAAVQEPYVYSEPPWLPSPPPVPTRPSIPPPPPPPYMTAPNPPPQPAAPGGGGREGGTAGVELTRGSAGAATVAADLDWRPSEATDWGDEPDPAPAPPPPHPPPPPPPPPVPGRPNFNPIMSARIQLEKLLGAGLQHLGGMMGGAGAGFAGAADPRVGGAASGVSVASAGDSSTMSASSSMLASCRTYGYDELQAATGGFSAAGKLGEGGYGPVYRGWLDGIPVAVKVMDTSEGCMQGRSEFEAEVSILSSLHHPHVVLLIGSCPDKGILVYELMTNGSLESHLFGGGGGGDGAGTAAGWPGAASASAASAASAAATAPLSWRERVRIAAEVASALLFLHTAPTPIVHMDLKPANILLDKHLTAKLGDVGLARLAPTLARPAGRTAAVVQRGGGGGGGEGEGRSTVLDSRLVGTFEYMDPEYMQTAQYSPRSDVYSLGMVMLQMLTGRQGKQVISLVEAERRQPLGFGPCIDPRAGPWPAAEAAAFADLALRCVAYSRQDRPDLRSVILPTLMQLKQRTQLYDQQQLPRLQRLQPAAAAAAQDGVPPMFLCPITMDVMDEPVVAADGYTYERLAITEWVARARTSPLTNLPLAHTQLVENRTLRSAIGEWRQQAQQQQAQQQQAQQQAQQQQAQQQAQQQHGQRGQVAAAAARPPPRPTAPLDSGGW